MVSIEADIQTVLARPEMLQDTVNGFDCQAGGEIECRVNRGGPESQCRAFAVLQAPC